MTKTGVAWRVRAASALGPVVLSGLMRTVTVHIDADAEAGRMRAEGQGALYAFWHGRMLPLIFLHRERAGVVLVSQHRDGEAIARVVVKLGYIAARGSTTRGGAKALLELVRLAREGRDIGVTPDGPRGPREVAQNGVISAARQTGLPIIPVATACDRAWEVRSWDRFTVPKPFSNVFVRYGAPIWIPHDANDGHLETVQSGMDDATRLAVAAAGQSGADEGNSGGSEVA